MSLNKILKEDKCCFYLHLNILLDICTFTLELEHKILGVFLQRILGQILHVTQCLAKEATFTISCVIETNPCLLKDM